MKKDTYLEDLFELQLKNFQIKGFIREYKFLSDRRFKFDFAQLKHKIAVEIQGKIWHLGGHNSGWGMIRDSEKLALANLNGWTTFFITEPQVKSEEGIQWIQKYLESK